MCVSHLSHRQFVIHGNTCHPTFSHEVADCCNQITNRFRNRLKDDIQWRTQQRTRTATFVIGDNKRRRRRLLSPITKVAVRVRCWVRHCMSSFNRFRNRFVIWLQQSATSCENVGWQVLPWITNWRWERCETHMNTRTQHPKHTHTLFTHTHSEARRHLRPGAHPQTYKTLSHTGVGHTACHGWREVSGKCVCALRPCSRVFSCYRAFFVILIWISDSLGQRMTTKPKRIQLALPSARQEAGWAIHHRHPWRFGEHERGEREGEIVINR